MKKFSAPLLVLFVLSLLAGSAWLSAQLPQGFSGKKFSLPWQDRKTSELKAILTGQNAKQISGSQVLVSDFGIQMFRNGNTNQVELIAEAPECFIDRSNSSASSAGKIKAYTASTNIYIEGEGFFCQQSNAVLIISNKVQTIIRKDFLASKSAGGKSGSPTPFVSGGTNENLHIFSDHFQFFYESNLVTYTGNVRVEDAQMDLTCDVLNIYFSTNKTLEKITAENRVVIVNKSDNSRATGTRATYTIVGENETVALTGNPFWTDGQQEGKADIFTFDRKLGIFRAEKNALFKVPRNKIGGPEFLGASASSTTPEPTGKPVEISADIISFTLPQTNRPIRQMIAERNVVITSDDDQSRATADKAIYTDATGKIELTGKPVWKIKESEIAADILTIDRTNRFFGARTNVQMKIPASLFGKALGAEKAAVQQTNGPVQIFSDDFSYTTNVATFRGNVRAMALDANLSKTSLDAGLLQIGFGQSNQVKTVTAKQSVILQQFPSPSIATDVLKNSVACESLILTRSPTGWLESIHAETNVVGQQIKHVAKGDVAQRISAEAVTIHFLPNTNQIDMVVAERNVFAEKIEFLPENQKLSQAHGERATYDSLTETVELTGTPTAKIEKIFFYDARVFRWNMKTGHISANPYRGTPTASTNDLRILIRDLQP